MQYPNIKFILGTWCYDVCEKLDGEWEGLTADLAKDNGWVQYIMADSHFEFPTYPLDHGVPGGLPMINFAERGADPHLPPRGRLVLRHPGLARLSRPPCGEGKARGVDSPFGP